MKTRKEYSTKTKKEKKKLKVDLSNTLTKTVKVQFFPNKEQAAKIEETMTQFMLACAFLSRKSFEDGFLPAHKLQDKYYHEIREQTHVLSQMACTACTIVAGTYDAIDEQLKSNPVKYEDGTLVFRDLSWLEHPAYFHTPQLTLQRDRDWCFKKGELSLNTIHGRVLVPYETAMLNPYLENDAWKFGAGKVIKQKGKWFFHISVSRHIDVPKAENIDNIVGIDRGIINTYASYDSDGNSQLIDGKTLQKKRDKYQRVRSSLQSKGTKGANRVLKKISGRENRWMNDVNHCLSKTLVSKYGENTLFVLENLTGVSFDEDNSRSKKQNKEQHSWTFFELELMIKYKAKEKGILVINVDPSYTSQRCPVCGEIHKEARHRDKHLYICEHCGFSANDDVTAAMNLRELGLRFLNGDEDPHFEKSK